MEDFRQCVSSYSLPEAQDTYCIPVSAVSITVTNISSLLRVSRLIDVVLEQLPKVLDFAIGLHLVHDLVGVLASLLRIPPVSLDQLRCGAVLVTFQIVLNVAVEMVLPMGKTVCCFRERISMIRT